MTISDRVPATPFELNIACELDLERERFANKWLFPWHQINIHNRRLSVENFNDGRIELGGGHFEGQPQQIYWIAIGRYLTQKVRETLQQWEIETNGYPIRQRHSSLDSTEGLLIGFVSQTVEKAIDTDQRLRGRGHPRKDVPKWANQTNIDAKSAVQHLAQSHRALLEGQPMNSTTSEKAVPCPSIDDFKLQAQHQASRLLSRLDDQIRAIEAKCAAQGILKSGPTVRAYAKAMVAGLEDYLSYLVGEISTFSTAGTPRSELIATAENCLKDIKGKARKNGTITKLEKALGGGSGGKYLDRQGAIFESHAVVVFNRIRLGLPDVTLPLLLKPLPVEFDVFLSHASEDKDEFANPFCQALEKRGLKVWYDTYSIEWGMPVRQAIDTGLANSRYGVVVLSPWFFTKPWPQAELDALLSLESAGGNRILPILHKLSYEELVQISPLISGKLARDTAKYSIDKMADDLMQMCSKI